VEHTAPHRWSAGGGDPIEQPSAGELQHGTAQEGVVLARDEVRVDVKFR